MTRRLDLIGVLLLVAAIAVGVWLGLAAPDISPVFTETPSDGRLGAGANGGTP